MGLRYTETVRGALFAGSSGYSYKEWKGSLFPEDVAPREFLRFYAPRFSTVEINNTFYRFPAQSLLEQWVAETPSGFTFAVKANQRITHHKRLKDAEPLATEFVERCASALGERLGPFLFQCPPNLRRDDERLAPFLRALPRGPRYAMEFRHASWFDEAVFDALREADVALVQSEDEKLAAPRIVTAGFCYLRLRLRDYTPEQLADWRGFIDARRDEGRDVYVYIKHDEEGRSPEPWVRVLEG